MQMPTVPDAQMKDEERWRIVVLFLLTVAAVGGTIALGFSFLPAIIWAVALKVATATPYDWLVGKVKNRTLAAALAVSLVAAIILLPAIVLGRELIQQLMQFASWIQSGSAQDWLLEAFHRYPRAEELFGQVSGAVSLRETVASLGGFVVSRLRPVLSASIGSITQMVLMLFTLFFLYRDQDRAENFLRSLLPLKAPDAGRLLNRLRDTISATVQGRLTIAVIQGCLGGVMFKILGVPNTLIWSVLMAIAGIIPSLGTFLVWGPVAAYLALTGHWVKGIILAAWGASVISTVDNFLYPTLVGSKLQLHTVAILFSMLGGVGLFGFTGLLLGPLILTATTTLLEIWNVGKAERSS